MDLQCPDVFRAASTRYRDTINSIQEENTGKSEEEKHTPKIRGTKLFVNGELMEDPVYVPTPKELLTLNLLDRNELEDIDFDQSALFTLSSSTFKAFCTTIHNYREVSAAYKRMKLDNLYVMHIIIACSFQEDTRIAIFSCDDGEDGAGNELEKLIKQQNFVGYAVFVIRWKLGGNMGPRCFKCILSVASKVMKTARIKNKPCHQSDVSPQRNSTQKSTPNIDSVNPANSPPHLLRQPTPSSPDHNAHQPPKVDSAPQKRPPISSEDDYSTEPYKEKGDAD